MGVVKVGGRFSRADVVEVVDQHGKVIARGLANFDAADVDKIKGLRSNQIAKILGQCSYDEVIHRDNLVKS